MLVGAIIYMCIYFSNEVAQKNMKVDIEIAHLNYELDKATNKAHQAQKDPYTQWDEDVWNVIQLVRTTIVEVYNPEGKTEDLSPTRECEIEKWRKNQFLGTLATYDLGVKWLSIYRIFENDAKG